MMDTDHVENLQAFYDREGLLVTDFKCMHASACADAAGGTLSRGAEAHVGSRYGEGLRVVVVSARAGQWRAWRIDPAGCVGIPRGIARRGHASAR